jgi:hypothetical protein
VKLLLIVTRGTTRKYQILTIIHNSSVALESLYMLVMLTREVVKYIATNGSGYWGESIVFVMLLDLFCLFVSIL